MLANSDAHTDGRSGRVCVSISTPHRIGARRGATTQVCNGVKKLALSGPRVIKVTASRVCIQSVSAGQGWVGVWANLL